MVCLVEEAIERFVEHDVWFINQVQVGIATTDYGDFVEHADMRKVINTRFPSH